MKTQLILHYLLEGNKLTQLEATRRFGTTRLGSIIFNLRKKYPIETKRVVVKDRYGNACNVAQYYIRDLVESEREIENV